MVVTYKNFIGGSWVASGSKKTFSSLNPARPKQVLGYFQASDAHDVDKAVRAAHKALTSWSHLPAPSRAQILFHVASLLRTHKQRLGLLVATEMGKVLAEALADVQEAIDAFEYMAGEGRRLLGHTAPSELPHKQCFTLRRPLGVVALITPWNFPLAIPAWKIAPALICGNTIVFKPSSDTPLCAVELVKILVTAGVPAGVVNLVTGSGDAVGLPLVSHSLVQGISFTGSKATGELIVQHAGVKKVGLELGGKNAIIVLDDADLDLAVDGVIWGAFGTTGQRCTACSRLIMHEKIKKVFLEKLLARVHKLRLGSGVDRKTDVGPLINAAAVEKSLRYVDIGRREGAKLLCGGTPAAGGFFFLPTIFDQVEPHMQIAQEEIFGPILSVLTVKNLPEAIRVANDISYGLSSAIYTRDIHAAFLAIEELSAGITYVNASTIGAEFHLPFGGVRGSGNGAREGGIAGIEEFSVLKTVYVDYSGKLQKAQIDTS